MDLLIGIVLGMILVAGIGLWAVLGAVAGLIDLFFKEVWG